MTDSMSERLARQRRHVFFTWSAQRTAEPLVIERAEGSEFWTAGGKRWIDFESQVFNAHLGHAHPSVVSALHAQVDSLVVAHPAAVFESKARLGERLAEVTPPGIEKFFLTLGGAEANENAIKIARLVTGRFKILSRYMSYHGATMGALSLTGDWRRKPFEPGIPGVVRVPPPYCYRCPWSLEPSSCARECQGHVERTILMEGPENVAAIIVEPISGAAGGFIPPDGYLRSLRALCDEHGILLIADEVMTGFGRTGRWFGCDHDGVTPDILTMAKGITGGHAPLGAVGVTRAIAERFDDEVLPAGLTCYGHPLGCAAGVAAIDAIESESLVQRSEAMGHWLAERLKDMERRVAPVDGTRARGLYGVMELVQDAVTRTPWGRDAALRDALRRRGLHMAVRDGRAFIAPPLVMSEALLEEGMDLLEDAIVEVANGA
jgi:taurine--2-oxoglutarate transaminase